MARVEPAPSGGLEPDSLHVVHCRAAGLDVHRMRITAAVRPAQRRGTRRPPLRSSAPCRTACGI